VGAGHARESAVAYDEDLANRVRELLQDERGLAEKKMFGGLAFLINGNMSVAVSREGGLLLRVDPGDTERLVSRKGARRFEMRGREMDGWLRVEASAVRTKRDLERWARIGVDYARSLAGK
jgi:TfoX/Sxy family transcriptional regulator of competence genes